jgi:hypothetical protein
VLRRADGASFCQGRAGYLDLFPGGPSKRDAKVYVRVAIGTPEFKTTAMLDTGSSYSVLDADTAEQLEAFSEHGAPLDLATRHGVLSGRLVRRPLWLLAEEGPSLEVEATFWVSPSWRFGHFLGYAGFLQRIRFALDPDANQFYFGAL